MREHGESYRDPAVGGGRWAGLLSPFRAPPLRRGGPGTGYPFRAAGVTAYEAPSVLCWLAMRAVKEAVRSALLIPAHAEWDNISHRAGCGSTSAGSWRNDGVTSGSLCSALFRGLGWMALQTAASGVKDEECSVRDVLGGLNPLVPGTKEACYHELTKKRGSSDRYNSGRG